MAMMRAQRRLVPLLLLVDLALVASALKVGELLRQHVDFGIARVEGLAWLTPAVYVSATIAWLVAFFVVGSHRPRRIAEPDAWRSLVLASCLGLLFFIAGLFFQKVYDFSRLLVAYFFLLVQGSLALRHLATQLALGMLTRPLARRLLLIGGGEVGEEVAKRLSASPFVTLVGVIATDDKLSDFPRTGSLKSVSETVKQERVDDVFIALPGEQHTLAEDVILRLAADPVRIHFVPDVLELTLVRARVEEFNGIPIIGLREPPINDAGRAVKRVFDLVVGSIALILVSPLMLLCALSIKLEDGGPVFFRQRRIGENGKPFDMIKFRSMVVNAEKRLKEVGVDLAKLDKENPVFKIANDPRVTPLGHFMRRWSLDEMPQLFNVLIGNMSLVGPRAEEAPVVAHYSFFHRKRLAMKPGVTGPMQIGGRGDLPIKQRINLELAYIEGWTLWSDLKILAQTIPAVLGGKGAY
jgi:exopolysaccharide biosynthesis polyprenyl glycosylphosphotransferase